VSRNISGRKRGDRIQELPVLYNPPGIVWVRSKLWRIWMGQIHGEFWWASLSESCHLRDRWGDSKM